MYKKQTKFQVDMFRPFAASSRYIATQMFLSETHQPIRIWSAIHRVLTFFPPSWLLQQKTMITIEKDIVAGVLFFGYVETFTIPSDRSGMVTICFAFFFVKRASKLSTRHWAGSKLECVELCNFHFCCALIFLSANEKIRIFGCVKSYSSTTF